MHTMDWYGIVVSKLDPVIDDSTSGSVEFNDSTDEVRQFDLILACDPSIDS